MHWLDAAVTKSQSHVRVHLLLRVGHLASTPKDGPPGRNPWSAPSRFSRVCDPADWEVSESYDSGLRLEWREGQ